MGTREQRLYGQKTGSKKKYIGARKLMGESRMKTEGEGCRETEECKDLSLERESR